MRDLVPIPPDRLPAMVGKVIHLAGAHPSKVWLLTRIIGDWIEVKAPQGYFPARAKAARACYVGNPGE